MPLCVLLWRKHIDDSNQPVLRPIKQFVGWVRFQATATVQVTRKQISHLIEMGLRENLQIANGIQCTVVRESIADMFPVAVYLYQARGL